jgi:hypothetical protein
VRARDVLLLRVLDDPARHHLPAPHDWSRWLASVPGFNGISRVLKAELSSNTPGVDTVDPADIAIVSGFEPPPPEDVRGWAIINEGVTEILIQTGADVAIGSSFRLDMTVQAVDCGRRAITANDCVIISVQQC